MPAAFFVFKKMKGLPMNKALKIARIEADMSQNKLSKRKIRTNYERKKS